jgi:hypothetical protein
MRYERKILSFATDSREKWIVAGNLNGELLFIDAERFEIVRELRIAAGGIEALDVHPTLPYAAGICGDRTIVIAKFDESSAVKLHTIHTREVQSQNEYQFQSDIPFSQAIAFHPRLPRILTRNVNGAGMEIDFDDEKWTTRWCRGYFREPDGSAKELVFTRYLVGSELAFLCGRGGLVVVDPEHPEEPLLSWRQKDRYNLHHAEHVEGDDYLLASDSRRVFRFDVSGKKPPLIGPTVTRDDLERINYNKASGRAFIAGFDRCVREIDPKTCELKGVVVEMPFKLRYHRTLERDPNTMIVQCRNGGLYKLDLAAKKVAGVLKETPNAMWSAAALSPREIVIAGAGPEVLRITAKGEDLETRSTTLGASWLTLAGDRGRFTKRVVVHPPTGAMILARSDGDLILSRRDGESRKLANLGAAVRDVCTPPAGQDIFAVTEAGCAYRVDMETGKILAQFKTAEEPLWSMAYNPDRKLLVVAEREGNVHFLKPDTLTAIRKIPGPGHTKRMKWVDANRLLLNFASYLYQLRVDTGAIDLVIPSQGNTIEDFAWTEDRRYLAFCTYYRNLGLVDFKTWKISHVSAIDMDFPHGLIWLHPERAEGAYPYELMAFGRSGVARRYRVHDERFIPMGVVNDTFSAPIQDSSGVVIK